jgi:predicted nucleic acid-binding protein
VARYLLDTDAVIDYLHGIDTTVSLVRSIFARGDSLCLCAMVISEVYAGLRPEDHDRTHGFLFGCEFLLAAPDSARQAGEWRYRHARRGVAVSTTDALIAATAVAHQATIVTGNVADYPMSEISVLPLPRARR